MSLDLDERVMMKESFFCSSAVRAMMQYSEPFIVVCNEMISQ